MRGAAPKRLIRRLAAAWPGVGFLILLLCALEIAVRFHWLSPTVVPAPAQVAQRIVVLVASEGFLPRVLQTLGIFAIGWVSGSVFGALIGILMGHFHWAYSLLEPLVELIRPIPKSVLIPPMMLLLGLGDAMKIAVVFLGACFPVLVSASQAARGVDPILLDMGRTFRIGTTAILWRIVLPAGMPLILSGMKVSLGISLTLVVLAEMLSGAGGMGAAIVDLQRLFRVQDVYAWVTILAIVGLVIFLLFESLERRIVFWTNEGPQRGAI